MVLVELCYMFSFPETANKLELDQGSVANRETNGERHHAGNKASSVSDNGGFVDIRGVGSERGEGGGEGSNGGSVLALSSLLHGLRDPARGQGLVSDSLGGRGKSRSAGNDESEKDQLEGFHSVYSEQK